MHAGRLHAFFWGAGRAGFPEILQIFRAIFQIFAQHLRDLDAELARYLAFERTRTRKGAAATNF